MPSNFYDGDFTTPMPVSQKRWRAPFEDNRNYVYEQDFVQLVSEFSRSPVGSPEPRPEEAGEKPPGEPSYKLVSEGDTSPWGPGVCIWTRTYARAPEPRVVHESYPWRLPGFATDVNPFPIPLVSIYNSGTPGRSVVATDRSHGLSIGDNVMISYNVKFTASSNETTHNVARRVLSLVGANGFEVDLISEAIVSLHAVRHLGWGRKPITKVVTSRLEIDYFEILSDTRYSDVEEIPTFHSDVITNNLNEETETYSETTTPTLSSYLAKVAASEWIVVESSILRQWMGHIYSRTTRYVRAQ